MKFIFFVLMCVSVLLSGCMSSLERKLHENIAEHREFVLYGKNDDMSVSLMCGVRESDYKINGYATEIIEFGVLTVTIDSENIVKENSEYILFVGTEKYSGMFEINPFDESLVADIKEIVDKNANVSVVIKLESGDVALKLQNVDSDWVIDSEDCFKIVADKYKDELKKFINNGNFEGEIYVKIMNDEKDLVEDFYFLISLYGRTGKSINIILSPKTGEILASNTNV